MALKKNDFIELEYIGKVKDGEIFDTNIKSEAKKINLDIGAEPLIICIGQKMILPALDNFLIGKEVGEYKIRLMPEQAFGNRHKELIKTVPLSVFKSQNQVPVPGMVFYFDNLSGKVASVSGGRVIIDFNNPLAGKEVEYDLNVKREILDSNEKIKAFLFYFTRKDFQFKIENKKVIISCSNQESKVLSFLKDRFKKVFSLELEVVEKPEKPKEQEHSKKEPEQKQQ